MIMVEQHIVKENDGIYKDLDNLCFLSKNLYNATLYRVRQYFFETKKYLNYNAVNKEFTDSDNVDYRALPAKVSKMTQMLVDQSFKSFFNKRKNGLKANIPKYLKKDSRQVINYTKQAISLVEEGYVKLSKTNIKIKTNISNEKIQFVRLTPKKKHIVIEKSLKGITINADVNGSYNILKKYLIKQEVWNEKTFSDCIEMCSTPLVINV